MVGVLLFPLLLLVGFFLRIILVFVLLLAAIWLIGKITLFLIEVLSKPKTRGGD